MHFANFAFGMLAVSVSLVATAPTKAVLRASPHSIEVRAPPVSDSESSIQSSSSGTKPSSLGTGNDAEMGKSDKQVPYIPTPGEPTRSGKSRHVRFNLCPF